jgi:hypothetical protein
MTGTLAKRIGWTTAYAVAMGYVEAAVVVYLRGLLNTTNTTVQMDGYLGIEIGREAATLVMLAAVGWLAGRTWSQRFAYFAYAFGIWDIIYYLFLKILIGWPESFFSPDVLFLIPVRWTGPVLAPVLISLLLCAASVLGLMRLERGQALKFSPTGVALSLAGGLLALYTFMAEALQALAAGRPDWNTLPAGNFSWPLFLLAMILMAVPVLRSVWPSGKVPAEPQAAIPEPKD